MKQWTIKKGKMYASRHGGYAKNVNKAVIYSTKSYAKDCTYADEVVVPVDVQIKEVK